MCCGNKRQRRLARLERRRERVELALAWREQKAQWHNRHDATMSDRSITAGETIQIPLHQHTAAATTCCGGRGYQRQHVGGPWSGAPRGPIGALIAGAIWLGKKAQEEHQSRKKARQEQQLSSGNESSRRAVIPEAEVVNAVRTAAQPITDGLSHRAPPPAYQDAVEDEQEGRWAPLSDEHKSEKIY